MTVTNSNDPLPEIVRNETDYDGDSNTTLLLGELGIGTKVYDHQAMKGLNRWMHENQYTDEVEQAVIGGGLLPEYPDLYSKKTNAERFRWIGQDEDKTEVPEATRLAELYDMVMQGEKGSDKLQDHVDDWIRGKLSSWQEVLDYAHKQMGYLFDDFDVERVDYCMGEEDTHFNRIEREVKFLKQFQREAESFKEEMEEKYEQVADEYDEGMMDQLQTEYEVLIDIHNKVSSHHSIGERYNNAHVQRFIDNNILEEHEDGSIDLAEDLRETHDLDYEFRQELVDMLSEIREMDAGETEAYEAYQGKYEELRDDLKPAIEHQQKLEETVDSIGDTLDKLELELEDELARINSRHEMEAIDPEILYAATKDEYTEEIKSCFPEDVQEILETHISRSATVENVEYGEDDDQVLEEAEVDVYGDMMVMHSTKFRSNTTTLFGLKEAERELLYRRMAEKVMKDNEGVIPKHIVVPHGGAGFQATRINTTPEFKHMDEDEYRDDPELSSITLLPTFQSVDKLIEFKDKGVRNWATKRIDKHLHASGAVFHTTLEDGSELYEYVDHSSLSKIGEKVEELEEYEEGTQEWNELQNEIQDMCARTYTVRATLGDVHLGAANFEGTPSNYERFQRTINYLTDVYGEAIDEVVMTEMVDGALEHTDIAKKFMADSLPDVIERSAERVKETRQENVALIEEMLDGDTVGDMTITELYGVADVDAPSDTDGLYDHSLRDLLEDGSIYELEEEDYVTALTAAAQVGNQNMDDWLDTAMKINDNWLDTHESLYEDVKHAYEQSSLPNVDKQFEAADPFLESLLVGTMPERVTLTAGNHVRSDIGRDEATQLEYLIERYDLDDDLEIRKSASDGSKFGGFGAIKDETVNLGGVEASTGKSVAFHHHSPGGTHANINTMRKLLESGYAFDEFFAGHVHHPRIGFTTGTAQTISPACQGPNDYSEFLKAKSAMYGTTVKFSNAAPQGDPANEMVTHGWHMVNDNTLEQEEFVDDAFTAEVNEYYENLEELLEENGEQL